MATAVCLLSTAATTLLFSLVSKVNWCWSFFHGHRKGRDTECLLRKTARIAEAEALSAPACKF